MEVSGWLANNWFELLSAIGIIGGLWFTAVSLRSETKTRRIANLLAMTESHRELWQVFYENVKLSRILDASADTASLPVNLGEEMYVVAVIQHLFSVYKAIQSDLTIKPEGIRRDVRAFFELPIPSIVWKRVKEFQDIDFASFVEACRAAK